MLALLKMQVWEPESRMFKAGQQRAPTAIGLEVLTSSVEGQKKAATAKHFTAMPIWWRNSDQMSTGAHQDTEIYRLLRWAPAIKASRGGGLRKLLVTRKQEYLPLGGDQAGFNAVQAEQKNAPLGTGCWEKGSGGYGRWWSRE